MKYKFSICLVNVYSLKRDVIFLVKSFFFLTYCWYTIFDQFS